MSEAGPCALPLLFGPTASGKTALALAAAEAAGLAVAIISADSRQVYTSLDIGTAKPTAEQRARVPHHLIDIITPDRTFAAGEWGAQARSIAAGLLEQGVLPFIVGGAGFYIRALFSGLGAPPADPEIVARLDERLKREGAEELYRELESVDPDTAALHDPSNGVRTVRALACWEQYRVPYSSWRRSAEPFTWKERAVVPHFMLLDPDRPHLYQRIDARVLEMVEGGLIEETKQVLAMGYPSDAPGLRTIGYSETVAYLEGRLDLTSAVAAMQQATRRYAKRQVTWMRGQMMEGERFDSEDVAGVAQRLQSLWR